MKLKRGELEFFINGVISGTIPDYQTSALLMAVYLNGLDVEEVFNLTDLMLNSGKTLGFKETPLWDKHSTGGVGDKVSIILAPILAAMGIKVPMISGRGLGHTGGTIDKLESIPGFTPVVDLADLDALLEKNGFFIISQSDEINPADRRLYALRDVTGTVDSIPLIVSSILSKKFAVNTDGVIIDVKCGRGGFMTNFARAKELAHMLEKVGSLFSRKVRTVITDMDQPLGRMVGNSLEVIESIEFLKGNYQTDLKELVFDLVTIIQKETGVSCSIDELIHSGKPLDLMQSFIIDQGGDGRVVDDYSLLPVAPVRYEIKAEDSGWIDLIDSKKVGEALVTLGGGRKEVGQTIDHGLGFEFLRKVGDQVDRGEVIAIGYLNRQEDKKLIPDFIRVCTRPVNKRSIFLSSSPVFGATSI
ncbi:MAG TPA: thymidine phosphorylase [bacterium (Candidatus Stahlbacteria)]|nr:thymidine phosphorylase [Candidatus Stahlbacteria bacterium]